MIDDEDQSIWPHTMVTVTVKLTRRPMLNLSTVNTANSSPALHPSADVPMVVDASTDLRCTDKDASWYLSGETSAAYRGPGSSGRGFDEFGGIPSGHLDEDGVSLEDS